MKQRSNFRSQWGIPLWLALRGAGIGSNPSKSKVETITEMGVATRVYSAKYIWMEILAYRFVRRHKKILAADSWLLVKKIQDRHGSNRYFMDRIPESGLSIGYLVAVDGLECVSATGHSNAYERDYAVVEAARYRKEKLAIQEKKRKQPDKETREAMILAWEASELVKAKERKSRIKPKTKSAIRLEQWRMQNEQARSAA